MGANPLLRIAGAAAGERKNVESNTKIGSP